LIRSSSVGNIHSPRNERKRLPSLDGSVDSYSVSLVFLQFLQTNSVFKRMQSNETQQQRWPTSTGMK